MVRQLWSHIQGSDLPKEVAKLLGSRFGVYGTDFLDAHGLQQLLLSEHNELFDPAAATAHLADGYMDHPLTDYFIASSHNSYLVGDQYRSQSDCRMYEQQLKDGCRCLEIDCWDGQDGEPEVTHGFTLTSRIKFYDVVVSIEKFAFEVSEYPVILSLEMHCSLPQQEKIARYMRTIFGAKLMEAEELRPHKHFEVLPSPNDLRRRIIAKGKTLVDEEVEEDPLSDDDDGGGGRDGRSAAVSTASEAGGGERRNRRGTLGQLTDFDPMKLAHLAQTTWAGTRRGSDNTSSRQLLHHASTAGPRSPAASARHSDNRASERDDGGPLSPPAAAPDGKPPSLSVGSHQSESLDGSKLSLCESSCERGAALSSGRHGSLKADPIGSGRVGGAGSPFAALVTEGGVNAGASGLQRGKGTPVRRGTLDRPRCASCAEDEALDVTGLGATDSTRESLSGRHSHGDNAEAGEEAAEPSARTAAERRAERRAQLLEGERALRRARRKDMKQKRPVHPSLSSAIALSSARFDGFCRPKEWSSMTTAELLPTAPAWQMSSFGESRASKALYEQRGAEWALHNSQQISRVYPRGSRIDSDNYDPLPLWNVGVQMAALNWQTHDLPQQLNMSKFSVNDRCGYVLKPPYLRRRPAEGEEAGDTRRETPVLEVPTTLTVLRLDILGAVHVPTPGEVGRGDLEPYHFPWWAQAGVRPEPSSTACDPFVTVEAFGGAFSGAAADRSKVHHGKAFCTSAVSRNGLNPRWDKEVAEVVASHPELTQIVLSVCYKPSPTAKAKTLGYAALPLSAVRSGVRCVPLCDERGARLLFCKLLVRATTDSCDTEATMARYHTTIQRDQQPLVRLPRDVREPFVQAAADVLGVSTAEDGPKRR